MNQNASCKQLGANYRVNWLPTVDIIKTIINDQLTDSAVHNEVKTFTSASKENSRSPLCFASELCRST